MSKYNKNFYDAIIIGAGISGLVCGCYLAKAGMKVLIIEQHNKPGGYFTSFRRGKFLFDAAAHSFGNYREGGHVRKILTELGVNKLIRIMRFDPSDVIITPDFKIPFYNDIKCTIAKLADIFPREKDNIINFFNYLTSAGQSDFTKLKDKTFSFLLHSFLKDGKLISSLALPVLGNGGLPPSLMNAFSGSKIFIESLIDGGYYPEGGIQALPNALESILKRNYGNIIYKRCVKKILYKSNTVTGVKIDNNEIFTSKYVISACDMTQTFKNFLGGKVIDKQIFYKLKNMIPSVSTFIIYIGINNSFKELPEGGTNIWYLPSYDLNKIYYQIQKCNFAKAGIYMLRVSPDKQTIVAFVNAPFKSRSFWERNKEKIAQDFLNRIEKLIPGIKRYIAYFDAASPYTLYRYTLNYRGAAFGWAKMPSLTFYDIISKVTFIKGLYLTGHWTSLASGLPGACYGGFDTAKRILRKEKIFLEFNKQNY